MAAPSTRAKRPRRPKPRTQERYPLSSMLSSRYKDVLFVLKAHGLSFKFHNEDDSSSCIEAWDTNIMGRFSCRNGDCNSQGWPSKAIATTIRLYADARYNAKIYHQRCMKCLTPGRIEGVDESYVERVSYWLKRWSGVEVEVPQRSYQRTRAPHQKDLCEGCRAGHCKLGEEARLKAKTLFR
jgi:hypothetical protein